MSQKHNHRNKQQKFQQLPENRFSLSKLFEKIPKPAKYTFFFLLTVGAATLISVLHKHEKTHFQVPKPINTELTTPQIDSAAKVTSIMQGWLMKFYFKQNLLDKPTKFLFVNHNTNDTIYLKEANNCHYQSSDIFRALFPNSITPTKYMVLPLNPIGENRITGIIEQKTNDNFETVYELDTIVFPKSTVLERKITKVYTENKTQPEKVETIAAIADKFNILLPKEKKFSIWIYNPAEKGTFDAPMPFFGYTARFNSIIMSSAGLSSPECGIYVAHECAHAYDFADSNSFHSANLKALYEKLMVACGYVPYPTLKDPRSGLPLMKPELAAKMENDPALKIFLRGGQATTDEKELFACVTALLIIEPADFLSKIEELGTTDSALGAICKEIAITTVNQFGSNKIFDPTVYKELGL